MRDLVEEVLATLPRPLGEDVIDDVARAIESRPEWLRRYEEWDAEHHRHGPQQLGAAVSIALKGPEHIRRVGSRSNILNTYTKLRLQRRES